MFDVIVLAGLLVGFPVLVTLGVVVVDRFRHPKGSPRGTTRAAVVSATFVITLNAPIVLCTLIGVWVGGAWGVGIAAAVFLLFIAFGRRRLAVWIAKRFDRWIQYSNRPVPQ